MIHADLAPLAVPLDTLETLPGNPRRGDVAAVVRSSAEFGQRKPIVARRHASGTAGGVVIAGNHQLAAARELGWDEIAVVWVDEVDPTYCDVICRRYQQHAGVAPINVELGEQVDFG